MSKYCANIIASVDFLTQLVRRRLDLFFKKTEVPALIYPQIELNNDGSLLCRLLMREDLSTDEKIIFLIAFVPHIQPDFFDNIIREYLPQGGDFAEIGGVKGSNQRSMLPTGETARFILAGDDLQRMLEIQHYLSGESNLMKENVIQLEKVKEGEPFMSGRIILSEDYLKEILTGAEPEIKFSADFPAKKITTGMSWEDAVFNVSALEQLNEIGIWLAHNKTVMEDAGLQRKIKPGYKVLFYGPPGTGKTLTAALLGKQFNKDVYKIDLSQIVSKFIGETEKNLEKVFAKAENKNWILFFDEADALFGKRTNVQNAHDRYANQEVSYLLQRVEDYPGLLILASNFKSNIDPAFSRRFNTIINFATPGPVERLSLWQKSLPQSIQLDAAVDIKRLADKYEMTGAAILNAVHYAVLQTVATGNQYIKGDDLLAGIKKEFRKEDKSIT